MISSFCLYNIPLQRATQCVAIADISILGVFNLVAAIITLGHFTDIQRHPFIIEPVFFLTSIPALNRVPYGLLVTVTICYAIQLVMGVFLYVATVKKHRNTVIIWMIMTALTAPFTGLFLRIYEILIVSEFLRDLKQEDQNENHLLDHNHDRSQSPDSCREFGMQPPPYDDTLITMDMEPPPRYEDVVKIDPPIEQCTNISIIYGVGHSEKRIDSESDNEYNAKMLEGGSQIYG